MPPKWMNSCERSLCDSFQIVRLAPMIQLIFFIYRAYTKVVNMNYRNRSKLTKLYLIITDSLGEGVKN